jgi:hypothetical protein
MLKKMRAKIKHVSYIFYSQKLWFRNWTEIGKNLQKLTIKINVVTQMSADIEYSNPILHEWQYLSLQESHLLQEV